MPFVFEYLIFPLRTLTRKERLHTYGFLAQASSSDGSCVCGGFPRSKLRLAPLLNMLTDREIECESANLYTRLAGSLYSIL
jgi:hypothetical protein